jgi:hypothetical protein
MGDLFIWVVKWGAILLSPVFASLIVWVGFVSGFFIYYRFKLKMKVPQSQYPTYKKPGIFKRLFWQFPRQFIDDMFHRKPDEFKEHGLHMWCGEQGSGKTTSVVAKLLELEKRYPKAKFRTNMNYTKQDGEITHWKDLVHNDNGIYGQVEVIDEIQTWFNSIQSKNFPPEMITEISQQRKQRKMIVGTAQVFSRIAKPIREQTTFVYLPMTILGCLTIVRVSKPQFWDDEKQTFKRFIRTEFFVHTKEVRDAFDTYKKIEKYKEEGFKDEKIRLVE